jgi:hypothetical protein
MHAADFELNVSLPADGRFAETMRDLAAHAARYAGCREGDADRYAAAVEHVARACLKKAPAGAGVMVIFRRRSGPLEFLIACERRFDAPDQDGHVTVGWTNEAGTSMCRVSLNL